MLKFRANKKRDREESEQGERTLIMWMCWVLLMVVESQKRVFKWASTLLSHTKSDQQWHKQQHRYTNLWFLFSFFGEWMFVRNNISNTHLKHKESRKKNFDHLLDSQVSEFDDFFCPSWNHVKHHRCHYYHHCVCLKAANNTHTHTRALRVRSHWMTFGKTNSMHYSIKISLQMYFEILPYATEYIHIYSGWCILHTHTH